MKFTHFPFKSSLLACSIALLAACNSITYHPTKTIEQIDPQKGYRLENAMQQALQKENLVIMTFSGGGSRLTAGEMSCPRLRFCTCCKRLSNSF